MDKDPDIYTSTYDKETQKKIIPEYDIVIDTNSITIIDIYSVLKRMKYYRDNSNDDERLLSGEYYKKIINNFENLCGEIKYMDINIENKYLLILTKENLFHLVETNNLPTAEFLYLCDRLKIDTYQYLKPMSERDQKTRGLKIKRSNKEKLSIEKDELYLTLDQINTLISQAFTSLARLNDTKITKQEHKNVIDYLTQEYQKISESFVQRANRIALLAYYQGMVRGITYIGLMAIGAVVLMFSLGIPNSLILSLVGSAFFGGMGALISVFSRMSSRKFSLDYSAGTQQNKRLGVFRPIIGSTMGVVIYFLLMGGLIPFNIPSDSTIQIYYVLSIAFTAGFTERWATGLLPGKEKDEVSEKISNDNKKKVNEQVQNDTDKPTVKPDPNT